MALTHAEDGAICSSHTQGIALTWTTDGKRPRGRQRETWRRIIERDATVGGLEPGGGGHRQKEARDGQKWACLAAA